MALRLGDILAQMEIPPPDPNKLLAAWMEWERGDATPGRAMANLKTGGLRQLLEDMASGDASSAKPAAGAGEAAGDKPSSWAPLV